MLFRSGYTRFLETPTKMSIMGKTERHIARIDHSSLIRLFKDIYDGPRQIHAYLERPYTGKFVNAMLPGQRAFEATLVCLEMVGIEYTVVDSKEWQKAILGPIKGSAELKVASYQKGIEMYPQFADVIKTHKDADGLLLADRKSTRLNSSHT